MRSTVVCPDMCLSLPLLTLFSVGYWRELETWARDRSSTLTSSSAIAKWPRDASCLSVVSLNSTKRRVESFIVSYVGYRFITACSLMRCSVIFGVTSTLFVINISSFASTINTTAYYKQCLITCETVAVVYRRWRRC